MFIAFACQCYSKKSQNWSEQELNLKQQQKRVKIWFYKIMSKENYSRHRFKEFLSQVQKLSAACVSNN